MDNWGLGKLGYSVRISNSVIKGIVKNYSTRFSLNSLAKEMEISAHKVVRDYLELLENLMLIKQVLDFISLKPEMTGIEVRWSNVPKKNSTRWTTIVFFQKIKFYQKRKYPSVFVSHRVGNFPLSFSSS